MGRIPSHTLRIPSAARRVDGCSTVSPRGRSGSGLRRRGGGRWSEPLHTLHTLHTPRRVDFVRVGASRMPKGFLPGEGMQGVGEGRRPAPDAAPRLHTSGRYEGMQEGMQAPTPVGMVKWTVGPY